MRQLLIVVLLATACSKVEPAELRQETNASYTKSMDLRADGEGGTIRFDTGTFRGTIEIGTGLLLGYKSLSQASAAGHSSKTILTIDGREMIIEQDRLRVGERVIGPLSGEVDIRIGKDGVFVDGAKKSEL